MPPKSSKAAARIKKSSSTRTPSHGEQPVEHLWQLAASFSARQHRHQIRKDGVTPYFSHVVRVGLTVMQVFGCHDDTVLCIALLHDTIEDTTTDYDAIESRFGAEIADGVVALTKNMSLPKDVREPEYDARIAKADWRVRLIKLADTYDNFCDSVNHHPDKVAAKRLDAIEKCRRAIALAKGDVKSNPYTAKAIAAVEALIKTPVR